MTQSSRRGAINANGIKTKCPICGAQTLFSATNPFRPFCSDVCHNKDLAAWASDHYQIAVTPSEHSDDESSQQRDDSEDQNF